MRDFQPYSTVVSALKTSKLLIVEGVDGSETIKRSTPVKLATYQDNNDNTDGKNDDMGADMTAPHVKKPKSKGRGKSAGKKLRGTGFEDWFCDAPITPEEFKEEKDIYHHSRSFIERIEQCIQHYRKRRNMDSTKANIFDKYLALGGVESGVKAFGGGALDKETLEEHNAAEIGDLQATDLVGKGLGHNRKFYHPANAEHWTVDFESVVKGFL